MSTKSRESLYGTTIRMSAKRAKEARKFADRLAANRSSSNVNLHGMKNVTGLLLESVAMNDFGPEEACDPPELLPPDAVVPAFVAERTATLKSTNC